MEFLDVHKQAPRVGVRLPPVRWSLPPEHCYKANFDMAFFENSGCAAIGVVYRDHIGSVIVALSQKIAMAQSVELVEALAAKQSVVFAKELSLFIMVIEGDSFRVIQALKDIRADAAHCMVMLSKRVEI